MKGLIVLLILLGGALAHIYSTSPRITYTYDGYPQYYSFYFSLQTGIGASDYLRIVWPENLHTTLKNEVVVNLISFSNSLQVATSTCVSQSVVGASTYHVTLGYAMQPKTWYELQVFPTRNPGSTPANLLIQLLAVSDYNTDNIIYDSNMAFAYVDILAPLASPGTLGLVCNSSSTQAAIPSAIYSYDIYLTPTQGSSTGGNFTIKIYYTAGAPMNTGTSIIDFSFMGLCQSAATNSNAAAVLLFCSISNDLSTITFAMDSVTANVPIRISTSISNPAYHSVRGIKAYWTEFISGRVLQNNQVNNALSVASIPIQTVTPRILLFWGIQSTHTDATLTTSLPLFTAASASPNILPYNSFNIGFSFAQSSPITGLYVVYVTLGASGVAEGTIAHNLPAYSGLSVYCYYDTTLANLYLVCKNVGAFINTNYRYFVSGKAYFKYTTDTPSPIANFGAVSITPIVYDSSGAQILTPNLYTDLAGVSTACQVSKEFLDTGGYHDTSNRKIGNARVVSFYDDLTLSSTANAMSGFLTGSNSSVGVIPDLGTSQQLLFLLNTPTAQVSSGVATDYTIQLMYNSYVVGFESGAETRGLDFVGYLSGSTAWSISGSPCFYHTVICQKYNNDTPTYNVKSTTAADSNGLNWYGMYKFRCGTTYSPTPTPACTSNCATECTMFTGNGTGDQGASTMAMRQVVLPTGYHSPLYADKNLLDFLFIFKHGASIISYCLINAFTLTGARMQNIKAAYVNYYDSTAGPYNKGVSIPMMLRIGGGVLPEESIGATAIGVFFDDNVDAQTFYTTPGASWAVGCSTGTCNYFPNKGASNSRTDNWLVNRQVTIFNLPPIQNEFNILVPVTPDSTRRSPPKYMTLAFFKQNYTVGTASGLLYTLAVYRLFGPVVTASISGGLQAVNGLARRGSSSPDIELSANSWAEYGTFGVNLNTTNMYSSPTNNTFTYSNNDNANTFGSSFGAGYTITCFYYNIFASATLSWATTPPNTASTCTVFGYVYNELVSAGNLFKTGRWVYTAFCPIDGTFDRNQPTANIDFVNPQYPLVFTNGFPLYSVLAIGSSSEPGYFRGYRKETNSISSLIRNCTTAKLHPYNPTSSGKQRAIFTLTIPAITMSSNGYDGYSSFSVEITIPSSTITGASFSLSNVCQTTNTLLSCVVTSTSTAVYKMRFDYVPGPATSTITYLEIGIYATVGATFQTAADYIVNVKLPQYISAVGQVPFGDTSYSTVTSYCTCQSSFTVGITPYGTTAVLSTLTFSSAQNGVRSPLSFIFGASSYRDAFFSTSKYQFNFGFLSNPNESPYYSPRSNFRCLVYEGTSAASLTLSSAWKFLDLSPFSTVYLTPKAEITNPASIVYKMQCYGGGIPAATGTDISGKWIDSADVQTAPNIAYSSLTLAAAAPSTSTIGFDAKRFNTAGMKALYSFAVSSPVALTSSARFYFDFHMKLSPYLDHQGVVECYIRTSTPIVDANAQYTYCSFTSWWQLMVWNNQNFNAGTTFYIDIYNIDLPKNSDVGGNQYIGFTIDADSTYSNGVAAYRELVDTAPSSTVPTDFTILTSTVVGNYILATQTLIITLNMGTTTVFTSGADIYVLFPASYAQWIYRSQTIPTVYPSIATSPYCQFNQTSVLTNKATACVFISQRILKISVGAITAQLFTLTLMNINTPAAVPEGKFNQYRFKLFMAGASENTVSRFSFTDYSKHLTLSTNPTLIALSWQYYSLAIADSKVTLTALTGQVITVQQGYYGRIVELRQSIFPSNFKATLQLTVSNYPTEFVSLTPLTVTLGKPTAYFRLAAKDNNTLPGLYTLKFSKTGDTANSYTNIPPLTLVVQNTQCVLSTSANTYTLPLGGMTLPIQIDAINCIPTNAINFLVAFSGTGNSQFSVNNDLSTLELTNASPDGKLYFVLKHTIPVSGSLVAGNSITVTITIDGLNKDYYAAIPTFTLTLVDATTFQNFPTGTALSSPTLSSNTATFQLQCSQSSRIYWGIGVYPSILNNQQVDFQARIISAGKGLRTNFTEQNDYYGRVYGLKQGTTMQVVSKTLYNLQSNVNYIFKYFCVNQMGHVSDSQSINFTTLNYGAYLMKVEITFRGPITYLQYQNLACSLAENFIIPYTRVVTEAMSYCGNTPYVFYSTDSSAILNQPDSNGWYIYGFYIEPDYTLPSDPTNTNIRNQLSLSTQATTIITSTLNYITLPVLVQMQTTDIQVYTTPILSLSSPLSGLTSVVVTASITNMNGFIVIGVMAGAFDSTTMTIPSAANIKNGIFSASKNLNAVKMIHTTQNYNSTFQFDSLNANTLYTFFYFSTVEDPAITALSSTVGTFSAQTLQMLTIDINWTPYIPLHLLAFLVLAIAVL